MRTHCLLHLAIAYLVLAAVSVQAEQQQGTEPLELGHIELRPFGYTNEQGRASGYLAKVTRAVMERIGQPLKFQELPASRLWYQIESGETDMTLGPKGLHQLTPHAFESEEPAVELTLAAYRKPETPPVSSLEDLKGNRVLLIHGYSYGQLGRFFELESASMEIEHARTHESALKMLLRDRADYLFSYGTPVETVMAENNIAGLVHDSIGSIPVHFFVSKKVDGAEKLVSQWDRALVELRENGELPDLQSYLVTNQ